MVFYFECSDPAYKIYMGKDKYENEDLIAYGFPEDIWFHACDLSSAHVYLRMPVGTELAQVPKNVMKEMAQLTKANSIEGSKMHAIDVTYTPWSNLKKTEAMKTGEVGMVDDKVVYHLKAVTRDRQMLKELERSRTSAQPDLRKALQDRNEEERQKRKAEHKEQKLQAKAEAREAIVERELRSYASLMKNTDKTETTQLKGDGSVQSCREIEEDFM
eukprot:GHVT01049383.1.p1 GENE.GHVT01049383.1~~GHVT01049383.1.p1  ORF type:complete len:216 (+),score=38.15 GHVT01049383.1:852-1499(+)